MREAGRWAPVLMLTARDSVTGLDAGALYVRYLRNKTDRLFGRANLESCAASATA